MAEIAKRMRCFLWVDRLTDKNSQDKKHSLLTIVFKRIHS